MTIQNNAMREPMVPLDCDLRGMEWMPFYGDRVFSSDTWLMASPEGRCAALALWWAAWKQCPTGSLPNQDRAIAQLAGYGMALKQWAAIRDEAMRGFVECSDGRLYHPVVSSLASEAWDRRVAERARKAEWRVKRQGTKASRDADVTVASPSRDADVPIPFRHVSPSVDESVRSDRTGQDRTGQDSTKEERKKERPNASRSPSASAEGETDAFSQFWSEYPRKVGKDAARRAWGAAIKRASAADILAGLRLFQWPADPQFIPHPSTWLNGGRWGDEQPLPDAPQPRGSPPKPGRGDWMAEELGFRPPVFDIDLTPEPTP